MKIRRKVLCAVTAFVCGVGLFGGTASAEVYPDTFVGPNYYNGFEYYIDGDCASIYGYEDETAESIKIPAYIRGYKVKKIGGGAFQENKYLKSIKLPDTIEEIGSYAFDNCTSLEKINLPEGLKKIHSAALQSCYNLVDLEFPSSLEYVGGSALAANGWLTSQKNVDVEGPIPVYLNEKVLYTIYNNDCTDYHIDIREGTEFISESGGFFASELASINFPSTLKTIEFGAFDQCPKLATVTGGENVTDVAPYAFHQTPWFTSTNEIKTLGKVIVGCGGTYTGAVNIPEGYVSIAGRAFEEQAGVTSVSISSTVSEIGVCAFHDCDGITSLTFAETQGITIGNEAFSDCDGLTSVVLPSGGPSRMEYGAFVLCDGLISAEVPGNFENVSDKAFQQCPKLQSCIIHEGVKSLGHWMFYADFALETLTIPSTIEYIENGAFSYQGDFTQSIIGKCIYSMKKATGAYTVPDGIVNITPNAFNGSEITSVSIPSSVNRIEYSAFENCKNLTNVILPESVDFVGVRAFKMCEGLQTITFLNPNCVIDFGYDTQSDTISNVSFTMNEGTDDEVTAYSFTGTIIGYENSSAQDYAERYGIKFNSLGKMPTSGYLNGDLTGDRSCNLYDVIEIAKYVMKMQEFDEYQLASADFNEDGAANLYDAIAIAKTLM